MHQRLRNVFPPPFQMCFHVCSSCNFLVGPIVFYNRTSHAKKRIKFFCSILQWTRLYRVLGRRTYSCFIYIAIELFRLESAWELYAIVTTIPIQSNSARAYSLRHRNVGIIILWQFLFPFFLLFLFFLLCLSPSWTVVVVVRLCKCGPFYSSHFSLLIALINVLHLYFVSPFLLVYFFLFFVCLYCFCFLLIFHCRNEIVLTGRKEFSGPASRVPLFIIRWHFLKQVIHFLCGFYQFFFSNVSDLIRLIELTIEIDRQAIPLYRISTNRCQIHTMNMGAIYVVYVRCVFNIRMVTMMSV